MQQNTVQDHITNGNLFPIISLFIKQDVETLVCKTFAELTRKVDAVLGLMRADLELVYGESSVQDGSDHENGSPRLLTCNETRIGDQDEVASGSESVDLADYRIRLAGQLDIFEKELGEIQEVISALASSNTF